MRGAQGGFEPNSWTVALKQVAAQLNSAPAGSVAIVASARQTNEELYLLRKIAEKTAALTDSVPRQGEGDKLLLNCDRNPNTAGSRLIGISAEPMGANLAKIADGIKSGKITTLVVFGEDVTKHGISAPLLEKLKCLVVSDILPNATSALAHVLLPGCAHVEKRGSFVNVKGRVQRFFKAVEAPGDARPEWEFLHELVFELTGRNGFASIEGAFNAMASETAAFKGVTWGSLGDTGVTVSI
jgi:NADH-quinone oxidoreductase subunit G